MKTKIKDLSNNDINNICKKYIDNNCENCPLRRYDLKTGREKLYCFKQCRALMYSNIEYYRNFEGMTEENKLLNIAREREEEEELEQVEIDL